MLPCWCCPFHTASNTGYTILESPVSQGHTNDRHKPRCACAVLLRERKFCSFATRTFPWFIDVPSRKIKAALPMAKTNIQISEELLRMMHSTKWCISLSECLQVWKQWCFSCSSYQEEPSSMSQTWKKREEGKWSQQLCLSECFLASVWEVIDMCRKGSPVSWNVLQYCFIPQPWQMAIDWDVSLESQACEGQLSAGGQHSAVCLSALWCQCFKNPLILKSHSSDSFWCWTFIHI